MGGNYFLADLFKVFFGYVLDVISHRGWCFLFSVGYYGLAIVFFRDSAESHFTYIGYGSLV